MHLKLYQKHLLKYNYGVLSLKQKDQVELKNQRQARPRFRLASSRLKRPLIHWDRKYHPPKKLNIAWLLNQKICNQNTKECMQPLSLLKNVEGTLTRYLKNLNLFYMSHLFYISLICENHLFGLKRIKRIILGHWRMEDKG